eukprot:TRINITY_DN5371_c0_g1_i1.p1 TRINITY_DN5371_c0_g1~~TRINITY_DN5371_c0_g1_i1.p1  ORF type:complete len:551 (+),score=90.92 TRINITY_DN5371_c0_g1_i1:114-1655(+)
MKVAKGRIRSLVPKEYRQRKETKTKGGGVMYWMSRDQRINDNWAFLHALELARSNSVPLGIFFCLVPRFCNVDTVRNHMFMLRGLEEVDELIRSYSAQISFTLLCGEPEQIIPQFAVQNRISHIVCDFSPLRIARKWKTTVMEALFGDGHANNHMQDIIEVDAHNVVPAWIASDKQEYAARTIRRKIHAHLKEYFIDFPDTHKLLSSLAPVPSPHKKQKVEISLPAWPKESPNIDWEAIRKNALQAGLDAQVGEVDWILPGEKAAASSLQTFITKRLEKYATKRNDPSVEGALSDLSPYFHFGQLSSQRAALTAQKCESTSKAAKVGFDAFFEEVVVRKELADNFCYYNQQYDSLKGCPNWAQISLALHKEDKREYLYSYSEFEEAKTHDSLWNAAQMEIVKRGKIHGYMRMYWAKKILEWTESADQALEYSIKLNDKFSLDGRDPNGYAGCMWSVGGLHDQGWKERKVFGKVRYMNSAGCKRKFNVAEYIRRQLSVQNTLPFITTALKKGKR